MADAALNANSASNESAVTYTWRHGNVTDLRYSPSAISITSFRLFLLPVWVTDYLFEDKPRPGGHQRRDRRSPR